MSNIGLMVSLNRIEFADQNVHSTEQIYVATQAPLSNRKTVLPMITEHENCLNIRPIKFDVTHQIWSR